MNEQQRKNEIGEIDDEYDDFFSGLQREIQSAESQGLISHELMTSIGPASTSKDIQSPTR